MKADQCSANVNLPFSLPNLDKNFAIRGRINKQATTEYHICGRKLLSKGSEGVFANEKDIRLGTHSRVYVEDCELVTGSKSTFEAC